MNFAIAANGAVVCDASVLAALIFGEPSSDEALALIRSRRLLAPTLLRYEIAQAAVSKCIREPRDAPKVLKAFVESLKVPVRLIAPSWPTIVQMAREDGLSAYDASYLQLAHSLRVPLATLDKRLADAAGGLGLLAGPLEP